MFALSQPDSKYSIPVQSGRKRTSCAYIISPSSENHTHPCQQLKSSTTESSAQCEIKHIQVHPSSPRAKRSVLAQPEGKGNTSMLGQSEARNILVQHDQERHLLAPSEVRIQSSMHACMPSPYPKQNRLVRKQEAVVPGQPANKNIEHVRPVCP